jgi:hypothetical protein
VSEVVASVLRQRLERGELWIDVAGDSMRPCLVAPARVRLRAARRPRAGQVWAFAAPDGSIVVHRCMGRLRGGAYGFRGDSAPYDDPPVTRDRLIGRMIGGRDARGARSPGFGGSRVARYQVRRALRWVRRKVQRVG